MAKTLATLRLQSYRRVLTRHQHQVVAVATALLFTTAVLGSFLPGPRVGPYHIFAFRLYLPFYAIGIGWYLWRTRWTPGHIPLSLTLFVGFSGWVVLSLVWAVGPNFGVSWVFFVFAGIFVGAAVFITADTERTMWWYLLAIFALIVFGEIVSIWEIFVGGHLHSSRLAGSSANNVRFGVDMASAWFGNRNNWAFFLALAAGPIFAIGYQSRLNWIWRLLSLSAIGLAVVIMVAGESRTGLLSFIATVLAIPVLSAFRSRFQSRGWKLPKHGAWAVTAIVLLGAIVVVAIILLIPNPIDTYGRSLWDRWQLCLAAMELFFETNGLGVGVGAFPGMMETTSIDTTGTLAPHNWLFYLLGGFGIVGTTLFLVAFAHLLYDLFSSYIETGNVIQLGLLAALLPLPLNAIGPSNALQTYVFWLFLALAAAAAYQIPSSQSSGKRLEL